MHKLSDDFKPAPRERTYSTLHIFYRSLLKHCRYATKTSAPCIFDIIWYFLICGIGIKKFPDIPNISLSWLQINILFSRWATPEKCNNALLPDTNVNKKHTLMRLKTLTSDATQSLDSRIFLPFIHYYSTTEDWPEAITFLRIDTPTERHTSNSPRRQDGPSRRHDGRLKDGRKLRWSKAILVRGYAGRSLWMKQQGLEGCRMACLVEKK